MIRIVGVLASGFMLVSTVLAHDLGAYGRVWGIEEVNIKQEIATELAHKNTLTPQVTLKKSLTTIGEHLPPSLLPKAKQLVTRYYDPSIALPHNIIVRGRLLYKKATWVNPLTIVRPIQAMLYFNAADKKQREFAIKALTALPTRLMLVATGGNPIALAANLHRPVYYARPAVIARFHITAVPSLLGVGQGCYRYRLAVTTFNAPYQVGRLKRCWHGCPSNLLKKEPV